MNDQHTIPFDHDQERLRTIKEYIKENIATDLHAATIAQKFRLSISAFLHFFKKYHGQPYRAYLEEVRMKKAFELLQNNGMRIKEVMYATGYTNRAAFNKAFKKRYKHAPGYFKK